MSKHDKNIMSNNTDHEINIEKMENNEDLELVKEQEDEVDNKKKTNAIFKNIILYSMVFIVSVIVSQIIREYLFVTAKIDGISMEETFHQDDRVVIRKFSLNSIDQGDVIIADTDSDIKVIKRVWGTPGDHVVITQGSVLINDEEVMYSDDLIGEKTNVILKNNEYFIMGDNFAKSYDSTEYGPITHDAIYGKVVFQLYPFGDIGREFTDY